MIKVYEKFGGIVISGVKIENKEDLKRYGIADLTHVENNVYKINKIVESRRSTKHPQILPLTAAIFYHRKFFQL